MFWRVFSPTNTAIIPLEPTFGIQTVHGTHVQQGRLYDFVKLRQFEQNDYRHFSINKATADWEPRGLPGLASYIFMNMKRRWSGL